MSVTDAELTSLSASHDIISIGTLADEARRRLHGSRASFVRVADIAVDPGAPISVPPAAGEVRLVGTPASCAAAVTRVAEVASVGLTAPLSAFSLADLERLAGEERVALRTLLEDLRAAGLDLVAEAPFDRLEHARRSIEEVNIAGLTLARLTLDRASSVDPASLFKQIAQLQREVAVVRAFAPLPRELNHAVPTTGYDDVKRVALARLIAENVTSIQVDWAKYGPKLAQVALTFGADDVDGVSPMDAGPEGLRRSPLEEILRNIRAAGFEPVERNGRFEPVSR
jgi:aminodeoxyfutalosine synthase